MSTFEESLEDIRKAIKGELFLDPYDVKKLLGNYEMLQAHLAALEAAVKGKDEELYKVRLVFY